MNENELISTLMASGMEYYQVRYTIKAIREYGNVDTLCVYYLPNERRRRWFLCNEHGIGRRVSKAYAKDCLRDAGHSAKAADLILHAAMFDPIEIYDLQPAG